MGSLRQQFCSLTHPGTPLQYSCLENPMDGGAWWAAIHGVATSGTWLSDFSFTFHFHALEEEVATHSSVLAWRIPGTGEPGELPSMGSHRVGHDWSDLAAAAAALTLWGFSLSSLYPGFIKLETCSCPPLGWGLLRGQHVLRVVTIKTRETILWVLAVWQHCAFYILAHLMLLWGCDLLSYGCVTNYQVLVLCLAAQSDSSRPHGL